MPKLSTSLNIEDTQTKLISTPSETPPAGYVFLYLKTDGNLYKKDESDVETQIGGGTGATQLTDLSDVNTATVTNRYVLVADGVDFESRLLTEADISDLKTYLLNPATANLDMGAFAITNVGTVDGRDLSVDGTKLDGIEALAEVNNISDADALDLTDGGESTLHSHPRNIDGGSATSVYLVSQSIDGGNA